MLALDQTMHHVKNTHFPKPTPCAVTDVFMFSYRCTQKKVI